MAPSVSSATISLHRIDRSRQPSLLAPLLPCAAFISQAMGSGFPLGFRQGLAELQRSRSIRSKGSASPGCLVKLNGAPQFGHLNSIMLTVMAPPS